MSATDPTSNTPSESGESGKTYLWEPPTVDGIATFRLLASSILTLEVARALIADLSLLTRDSETPPLILVDMRRSGGATREARTYLGRPTSTYAALALLVGSAATQVIANFFIALNHPNIPTRIFTDEEKALQWLRGYVA